MKLEEIERHLMGVYVDKIGVEFMHSPVKSERLCVPPLNPEPRLPDA